MTKMRRATVTLLKCSDSGVPFEFTIAGWPVEHPAAQEELQKLVKMH